MADLSVCDHCRAKFLFYFQSLQIQELIKVRDMEEKPGHSGGGSMPRMLHSQIMLGHTQGYP